MNISISKIFDPFARVALKKKRALTQGNIPQVLSNFYSENSLDGKNKLLNCQFIALDIETTGLNPEKDDVLSIGWVEINKMTIDLSTAQHFYIYAPDNIKKETAVINHIVPETLENGHKLELVIKRLISRLAGKIVIAHGANIERCFLSKYISDRYHIKALPIIWIDTMELEKSILSDKPNRDIRLSSCRNNYNLPKYPAHNALIDAIAAAELYLAQSKAIFGKDNGNILELYNRCN